MRLTGIHIKSFRAIRDVTIDSVENALILVGQNNTGKSTIIDALRVALGDIAITKKDFNWDGGNIEIALTLELTKDDLKRLCRRGIISRYRKFDSWFEDFQKKLPSFVPIFETDGESINERGELSFCFIANKDGRKRYFDGFKKNNPYIEKLLPRIYSVSPERDIERLQSDLLLLREDALISKMRSGCCLFEEAKTCDHCFSCIGYINQKKPIELDAFEASKLLDYKLYQLNLEEFSKSVNENFKKNGGQDEIVYSMNRNVEQMLQVTTEIGSKTQRQTHTLSEMGEGMRSIYLLSLLETYTEMQEQLSSILMIEEPELFLHPTLQRVAGEILYRLSRKNQVVFTTHSPNLLANFNSREIRQVVLDKQGRSIVRDNTDISVILDDLGYTATDLMNVNFVFIVEGKQDKNRLPILLKRYYSEIYDKDGNLSRIAIITTNSCTNIKTYANLKYMNQVYLKDQFLMIRDGDGKDRRKLISQLCNYYEEAGKRDVDHLPKVRPQNVLVLKYYSFENYFFNPKIMAQLGVVESENAFYQTFYEKWQEYFTQKGFHVVKMNAKSGAGVKNVLPVIMEACKEKIERDKRRGIKNRPIRAMVVGIPNVGKSTFINAFAGKACAKTGNKPGVTKGKQWIRINKNVELLDTPGILWPKFEDQSVGAKLAMIGSMNDQILNLEELSLELLGYLHKCYEGILAQRYELEESEDRLAMLSAVAKNRNCLKK